MFPEELLERPLDRLQMVRALQLLDPEAWVDLMSDTHAPHIGDISDILKGLAPSGYVFYYDSGAYGFWRDPDYDPRENESYDR